MIEVVLNDRLGKKIRVKCNEDDTVGDLKKLVAAQTGTRPEKIRIQKWHIVYKDHITLADYEIHDGMVRGASARRAGGWGGRGAFALRRRRRRRWAADTEAERGPCRPAAVRPSVI